MESRHHRATSDAKRWKFTRRELVSAGALGAATLLIEALIGGLSWKAVLISLGTVGLAAILIPIAVYTGSWLTAGTRIHRDALIAIQQELATLNAATAAASVPSVTTPPRRTPHPDLSVIVKSDTIYINVDNSVDGADALFGARIERITGCEEALDLNSLNVKWLNATIPQLRIREADSANLELARYSRSDDTNPYCATGTEWGSQFRHVG